MPRHVPTNIGFENLSLGMGEKRLAGDTAGRNEKEEIPRWAPETFPWFLVVIGYVTGDGKERRDGERRRWNGYKRSIVFSLLLSFPFLFHTIHQHNFKGKVGGGPGTGKEKGREKRHGKEREGRRQTTNRPQQKKKRESVGG